MRQRARVTPKPRIGQGDVKLSREEFYRRLRERFADPAFDEVRARSSVGAVAWDSYDDYRKSPRTRPAGPGFEDPRSSSRSNGSKRARDPEPRARQESARDHPGFC